ncbi:MAG: family 16 glycoside hydrolase [Balneolales bacterium]
MKQRNSTTRALLPLLVITLSFLIFFIPADAESQTNSDELNVLMISGGGWHDYEAQIPILEEGLTNRIGNIKFTVDNEHGDAADSKITRHQNTDWASEFDLVVYNHCHSGIDDDEYIERIVDAHVENQLPAVMLHCSMHSYRGDTSKWFEFVGARSHRHEGHQAFTVEAIENNHPIMVNFPKTWRTPHGELYEIAELMPGATPLARAYGIDTDRYHTLAWTNEYEGVPVFSSTLGHHNETMGHDVNLNLIASGILWASGNLNNDGTASDGYEGDRGLGWISLWDGETFDGWRASENTESFQINDDKIVVDGPRSHLYYQGPVAGGDFKNFEFKGDVYTYPDANSGIFFHSRFQENGWPQYGYEAQVNATHTDRIKTGSLYSVHNVMDDAPNQDNEWFHYNIKVDDRDIRFKVDGNLVMEFAEPSNRDGTIKLNRGTIALQAHDPNSRIYYKDLFIRVWPD